MGISLRKQCETALLRFLVLQHCDIGMSRRSSWSGEAHEAGDAVEGASAGQECVSDLLQTSSVTESSVTGQSTHLINDSAAARVKNRVNRELSEKGKLNRVNELKVLICKQIDNKLSHYENIFYKAENDFDVLSHHLVVLESDGNEIADLYKEFCELSNKHDDTIPNMCNEFEQQRKNNETLISMQLEELNRLDDEAAASAAAEAEAEVRRFMEELEEKKRRQEEARRTFTEKQMTLRSSIKNSAPSPEARSESSLADSSEMLQPTAVSEARDTRTDNSKLRKGQSPCRAESFNEIYVVDRLADSITASMKGTKRSVIEPSVFSGDILEFGDWEADFDDFLESEGIAGVRKLRMLKKYVSGKAKKCISGFLLHNTMESYSDARRYLKERYGKNINLARQFKKELFDWPKIPQKDGEALRDFADYLVHCRSAMKTIKELRTLDEPEHNESLVEKLPEWLKNRWKYRVASHEELYAEYPSLSVFTDFIVKEAKAANVLTDKKSESKSESKRSTSHEANKKVRTLQTSSDSTRTTCVYCNYSNHTSDMCRKLQAKPYPERIEWIKSKRLCYACLSEGHRSGDCKDKAMCKSCDKRHPTVLHKSKEDWEKEKQQPTKAPNKTVKTTESQPKTTDCTSESDKGEGKVQCNATRSKSTLLSMVLPVYVSTLEGKETLVYALLDSQSDASFISEETAKRLSPAFCKENITISTINGEKTTTVNHYRDIVIRGYYTKESTVINPYGQETIPCDRTLIPSCNSDISHLSSVKKHLAPALDIPVGLLIGVDCPEALAPLESVVGGSKQAFAQKTMLGWTICGGQDINSRTKVRNFKIDIGKDVLKVLNRDFEDLYTKDEAATISQDDLKFNQILESNTVQQENGFYQMPLPFRSRPCLPDNLIQAEKRFESLKRKFEVNPSFQDQYTAFMDEVIQSGQAELVPLPDSAKEGETWYIPHFAVTHPQKKKIRVVFDCKATYKETSLNHHLLQGPDHINSLLGILSRFRKEKIAICCDIKKMFYNFFVSENDRDFLRFLWLKDGRTVKYRMKVHLFGARSSPAVATYGLRKLAMDNKRQYEDAARFLNRDFYVDDGITSVDTVEKAKSLIDSAKKLCSKGNLCLHKVCSNSKEVLHTVPEEQRAVKTVDLLQDSLPSQRTLGMEWCMETDTFIFLNNLKMGSNTRRGILSMVAQIFDPLGFLAPFVLPAKAILQAACEKKLEWDQPIGKELESKWNDWKDQLTKLEDIQIPRRFKIDTLRKIKQVQLHHFSDASEKGYGACSYLRYIDVEGHVHCSLVMGKARVVPLKRPTLPRLELQAAVIAARMSKVLKAELDMQISEEYFWTDSEIVLGYLNNEAKKFHIYVANRIQEILTRTKTEQWHFISGTENPADIASRGLRIEQITNSKWIKGPNFLWETNIKTQLQSISGINLEISQSHCELKKVQKLQTMSTATGPARMTQRFEKFGSFNKLVRSIAIWQQVAKKKNWKPVEVTVQALQDAETYLTKTVQEVIYHKEIEAIKSGKSVERNSHIQSLNPYLDENGVLRVGGRLSKANLSQDEKHPAIIPKHSHWAKLLIRHYHRKIQHMGRRSTLAAVREAGYWMINGASTVKAEIRNCVTCAKLRRPTESQMMGNLPKERLEQSPPFTHVGMDVFGPYLVKDRRSIVKRYGLIFTCLYSRAVHIEMLDELSTDSFINALRCFTAIRGHVTTLYSDNATNFTGAKNLFNKELDRVTDARVRQHLLDNKIDFKTNSPDASHQGGCWERLIRSARAVLNGMAHQYKERLDSQTLRTAFYEASCILNNKPLTATDIGSPDESIVTPNQLLTMKRGTTPAPPPGVFNNAEIYGNVRWKKAQQFAEEFYRTWKSEYLSQVTKRQKWTAKERNLTVGDVVLLKEESLPRNSWSLAIIRAVHKGDDEQVRNVTLQLANRGLDNKGKSINPPTVLTRPVQKVVLLVSA